MLTPEEQNQILALAKESIESKFLEGPIPVLANPAPSLEAPCGAFVSLHKKGALRGCMGRLSAEGPLWETVSIMAREAAFRDPRFPPLGAHELDKVDLEISVLSPLEGMEDLRDIEVGRHGIYLVKGAARGVLLPQVAVEYGWDRETFLAHTARKAGLAPSGWKEANIYLFTAQVFGDLPGK